MLLFGVVMSTWRHRVNLTLASVQYLDVLLTYTEQTALKLLLYCA